MNLSFLLCCLALLGFMWAVMGSMGFGATKQVHRMECPNCKT
jgi:hypothetical protein